MDTATFAEKKCTKLFVGFLLTSELKMHLQASALWKNARFTPDGQADTLREVSYEKAEYIGRYLDAEKITLSSLAEIERLVAEKLQLYCPQIDSSKLNGSVFSQLFIQ